MVRGSFNQSEDPEQTLNILKSVGGGFMVATFSTGLSAMTLICLRGGTRGMLAFFGTCVLGFSIAYICETRRAFEIFSRRRISQDSDAIPVVQEMNSFGQIGEPHAA